MTFRFINTRIQLIYASKFGNNLSIDKVYKKSIEQGDVYDIFYKTDKGAFFVSAVVKNDNNFDINNMVNLDTLTAKDKILSSD